MLTSDVAPAGVSAICSRRPGSGQSALPNIAARPNRFPTSRQIATLRADVPIHYHHLSPCRQTRRVSLRNKVTTPRTIYFIFSAQPHGPCPAKTRAIPGLWGSPVRVTQCHLCHPQTATTAPRKGQGIPYSPSHSASAARQSRASSLLRSGLQPCAAHGRSS